MIGAHVDAGRVGKANALLHQSSGKPELINTLQLGQLHRAIHASNLRCIGNLVGNHSHAISHSKLHDIGQVILALRVLVIQPRQPATQQPGGHGHDAAVNFLNMAFGLGCVFLLGNGAHLARGLSTCANNTAIARGVSHFEGQQRQPLAITFSQQSLQGGGLR